MKLILIIAGILTVGGILFYVFYYNKPHLKIENESIDYELSANELLSEFKMDEVEANKRFSNKIILVSGQIQEIINAENQGQVILLNGSVGVINCEVNEVENYQNIEENDFARIKGLFIGYNDLLNEVQLKKCQILEN